MPTPPTDPADLLVRLATDRVVSRAPACRLGVEIERWAGAPSDAGGELAAELGVPETALRAALGLRTGARDRAARARREASRIGARLVTRLDPDYPVELHDLELPPPALWVRGRIPPGPRISIVGSRRMGWYGRRVAQLFARHLAGHGVAIVSGFARGVDTAAHEAALEPAGGRTVAVLGCGLDVDYPRGSRRRADAVAASGALVSELAPGTSPRAAFFPQRNRIIAALGLSTLVVQAAPRSGSLVTARHALELGRDVWAVPGEIFDEGSAGTNALIADGALVARHPDDLVEGLEFRGMGPAGPTAGGAPDEASGEGSPGPRPGPAGRLLAFLRREGSSTAEALAAGCDLGVEKVLALMLDLELDGSVRREPGPRWRS